MEKLTAVNTLMEAFGNSRTILNTNGSRYAQLTTLDFDHSGQISSASVQVIYRFANTKLLDIEMLCVPHLFWEGNKIENKKFHPCQNSSKI